jgi:hypothetical protein
MKKMPSKGIIYCATGIKYLQEASISAESLKKISPDYHITLFTNEDLLYHARKHPFFDNFITVNNPSFSFRDKIFALQNSPYLRTLFLDSDTYVLEPLDDLYSLLDKFDIAAAHEYGPGIIHEEESRLIPTSFPQLNTGVIAFRDGLNIKNMLIEWMNQYDRNVNIFANDQCSFRNVIYNSTNLRVYVLRPEYNFRMMFPGSMLTKVKIIHDHNFLKLQRAKKDKIIHKLNSYISKSFNPRPLLWTGESDTERPGFKVRIWLPEIGSFSQEDIQKSPGRAIYTFYRIIFNVCLLSAKKLIYRCKDLLISFYK